MVNMGLIYTTAGYFVAFVLALFVINFLTQGFVFIYLKVKAGRGQRVLMKVYSLTGIYWAVGQLESHEIVYKPRGEKLAKRINIARGDLGRMFNVPICEVDDEKNAIKRPDFSVVTGYDAQKADLMVQKALLLPRLENKNLIFFVLILCVVILLALLFVAFRVVKLNAAIAAMNVITGGVI